MHMILCKEIADVDAAYFEKIGHMAENVVAFPTEDQQIALKGSAPTSLHHEVNCQNTLFLTYEAGLENGDSLKPGWLYKYTGDSSAYQGATFVELKYEHQLGSLKLEVYFLVLHSDCEFAVVEGHDVEPYTLTELWDNEFIRRIDNG